MSTDIIAQNETGSKPLAELAALAWAEAQSEQAARKEEEDRERTDQTGQEVQRLIAKYFALPNVAPDADGNVLVSGADGAYLTAWQIDYRWYLYLMCPCPICGQPKRGERPPVDSLTELGRQLATTDPPCWECQRRMQVAAPEPTEDERFLTALRRWLAAESEGR